jgi:hypothetical protein
MKTWRASGANGVRNTRHRMRYMAADEDCMRWKGRELGLEIITRAIADSSTFYHKPHS